MPRPNVPLQTALDQLLTEVRLGHDKAAAQGLPRPSYLRPVRDPVVENLRKLAAALRDAPASRVTYADLNRVKETLYGKR